MRLLLSPGEGQPKPWPGIDSCIYKGQGMSALPFNVRNLLMVLKNYPDFELSWLISGFFINLHEI